VNPFQSVICPCLPLVTRLRGSFAYQICYTIKITMNFLTLCHCSVTTTTDVWILVVGCDSPCPVPPFCVKEVPRSVVGHSRTPTISVRIEARSPLSDFHPHYKHSSSCHVLLLLSHSCMCSNAPRPDGLPVLQYDWPVVSQSFMYHAAVLPGWEEVSKKRCTSAPCGGMAAEE